MTPKHISAADRPPVKVVLLTMDTHLASVTAQVNDALRREIPGLSLQLHAASEWNDSPAALTRAQEDIASADIIFGNMLFMAPDECKLFPAGVPDLFVSSYAPADYVETVNTTALPRYLKAQPMDFDKGIELEAQMNVLPLCTRPRTLITAKAVAVS